ncbi:MAG: DUF1684 domain-containing protein [Bacteroidota bacterium]
MRNILTAFILFFSITAQAQKIPHNYIDSITDFQSKYVNVHKVVLGEDRKHLHFFEPNSNFRILADFIKIKDSVGFKMVTSKKTVQHYYKYGKINFKIKDTTASLFIYQSKDLAMADGYKDYLFIPFTDATTGIETYEGGRYLDLYISEISNNKILIDFNKAYNPYCCYSPNYQCPIPPKENELDIFISAGEKKYTKPIH